MKSENPNKAYFIEIKPVSLFMAAQQRKTRGEKMKVSSIMLLKTNRVKMSGMGLSIMFMKTKVVTVASPLC